MTLSDSIIAAHSAAAHILWSTFFVSASALNPQVQDSFGYLAPIASWIMLASLLPAFTLSLARVVVILVNQRFHEIFGAYMLSFFKLVWDEFVELKDTFLFKVVFGVVSGVLGLLTIQWFRFHLDIVSALRAFYQILDKIWAALFDLPRLVALLHDWLNRFIFKVALDKIMVVLLQIVEQDAWLGLIVIFALCVVSILAMLFVKHLPTLWQGLIAAGIEQPPPSIAQNDQVAGRTTRRV